MAIRFRAGAKVNDVEVFGYEFDIDGDEVTVPLENFYSEESRSLLMKLELDPAREGELDLGEITLVYHDYLADKAVDVRLDISVEVSDDEDEVERSRDEHVVVEAALTGNPELVYQALCYDPLTASVLSLDEIRKMVKAMLRKNEDHLPQFDTIKW